MASPDPAQDRIPKHVAVVMDGNGRWANGRGLPRYAGHRAGVKATRALTEACVERGIEILTCFAFSSENWRRPRTEVGLLMDLLIESLHSELPRLHEERIRMKCIGDRSQLGTRMAEEIEAAEEMTRENDRLTLNIAIAYGGRWDILQAARSLARSAVAGELDPDGIDLERFEEALSLSDYPDPDLLIRTGGEFRLSNFLLWDVAYTELYFTEELWPDFNAEALDRAIEWYGDRQRRFGRTTDQLETDEDA